MGTIYEDMRKYKKMRKHLDRAYSLMQIETSDERELYIEISRRLNKSGLQGKSLKFMR